VTSARMTQAEMERSLSETEIVWFAQTYPEIYERHGTWLTVYHTNFEDDYSRCKCGYPLADIKADVHDMMRHRHHVAAVLAYYLRHNIQSREPWINVEC
jgi:hypothetical protein